MPARGRGDVKTGRWKRLRLQVLERDRYECQIAGPRCTGQATAVDHIMPFAYGGDDSLGNLRAACRMCNSVAGGRMRQGVGSDPRRSTPAPPASISLAEPRENRTERRTHRPVTG
jgi:5-methylcytosine-specific restriction enzyme A